MLLALTGGRSRRLWVGCIAGLAGLDANAQTARVDVSHNDPDGIVFPGETIRVTVLHTRDGGPLEMTFLAHAEGDVTVSPNLGQTSEVESPFIPAPGTMWTVNAGSPSGASLLGFEVDFPLHPDFYIWHPTLWVIPEIDLLSFDWTAPSVASPTGFTFNWAPSPIHPNIEIYNVSQIQSYPIPTTYTSASIVVLPAPAGLVIAAAAVAARRRRRSGRAA